MTTGAALWKPFESDTGRIVRLKFANPLSTLAEVNAMASSNSSVEFPMPGHGFTAPEISQLRIYDKEPELSRFDTHRGRKPIIRNCPECDAIGYHSWLFHMSWLIRCPVHGHPLSELNRVDEEWRRFKGTLRASLRSERSNTLPAEARRWHLLWKQDLLEPKRYFSAMLPFAKLSHSLASSSYKALSLCSSFHCRKHAYDISIHLDHHRSIAPSNPHFSSFIIKNKMAACEPDISGFIRNEKLVVVNFTDRKNDRLSISDHTRLARTCQHAVNRVENRISRFVTVRNKQINHLGTKWPTSTTQYSKDMNVALVSFLVWRSLVRSDSSNCVTNSKVGVHLYRQITGPMMPLRPIPMTHGAHKCRSEQSVFEEYPLPISVSTLVYELDCWCLYRAIYAYLDSVVFALNMKNCSTIELRDFIPMWTVPGSHYSNRINVFLKNSTFQLTFPESYLHIPNRIPP